MENLNLNYNSIESQGSQSIFSSSKFQKLKRLTLVCNKIECPVEKNLLCSLNYLSLANNKINSEGARLLLQAEGFNYLEYLDLYKNQIEIPCDEKESNLRELAYLDLTANK